jgi:hypothetical protein
MGEEHNKPSATAMLALAERLRRARDRNEFSRTDLRLASIYLRKYASTLIAEEATQERVLEVFGSHQERH